MQSCVGAAAQRSAASASERCSSTREAKPARGAVGLVAVLPRRQRGPVPEPSHRRNVAAERSRAQTQPLARTSPSGCPCPRPARGADADRLRSQVRCYRGVLVRKRSKYLRMTSRNREISRWSVPAAMSWRCMPWAAFSAYRRQATPQSKPVCWCRCGIAGRERLCQPPATGQTASSHVTSPGGTPRLDRPPPPRPEPRDEGVLRRGGGRRGNMELGEQGQSGRRSHRVVAARRARAPAHEHATAAPEGGAARRARSQARALGWRWLTHPKGSNTSITGLGAVCTRTRFQWLLPGFQKNSTGADTRWRSDVQSRGRLARGAQEAEKPPPSPAGAALGQSVPGSGGGGVGMAGQTGGEGRRLGAGWSAAEGGDGDRPRLVAERAGAAAPALPPPSAAGPPLPCRWAAAGCAAAAGGAAVAAAPAARSLAD